MTSITLPPVEFWVRTSNYEKIKDLIIYPIISKEPVEWGDTVLMNVTKLTMTFDDFQNTCIELQHKIELECKENGNGPILDYLRDLLKIYGKFFKDEFLEPLLKALQFTDYAINSYSTYILKNIYDYSTKSILKIYVNLDKANVTLHACSEVGLAEEHLDIIIEKKFDANSIQSFVLQTYSGIGSIIKRNECKFLTYILDKVDEYKMPYLVPNGHYLLFAICEDHLEIADIFFKRMKVDELLIWKPQRDTLGVIRGLGLTPKSIISSKALDYLLDLIVNKGSEIDPDTLRYLIGISIKLDDEYAFDKLITLVVNSRCESDITLTSSRLIDEFLSCRLFEHTIVLPIIHHNKYLIKLEKLSKLERKIED